MKVLFICTGNTCRSPMAEGLLRDMAEKKGLDIDVKSAGIAVYSGDYAAENSVNVMRKINIDISEHRASQIDRNSVDEASLILTMSDGHKDAIVSNFPSSKDKIFNLLEYAYGEDKNVVDPYGGSLEIYEKTRDEIYEALIQIEKKGFDKL